MCIRSEDVKMILDCETMSSLAHGVEYTEVSCGVVRFSRFSKRERELLTYGTEKSYATAGVRLEFETDSNTIGVSSTAVKANPLRYFYSFDVCCNGEIIGSIKNCDGEPEYPYIEYPFEERHDTFLLPKGVKRLCIHFPWSAVGTVERIELDDGAFVRPIVKRKKIIMYGDSITQGYDSLNPSHSYAARLAEFLDADAVNKGIGGSVFMPSLVSERVGYTPDIITVAYGTNDWRGASFEGFSERCERFFANLAENYPDTPIAAISPIWRADFGDIHELGEFSRVAEKIRSVADMHGNVFFIDGTDFIPKDTVYFRDGYLHPNDKGFEVYASSLAAELERILPCLFI